jgi:drug/metabolite transporter (DMT)-like permease
VATTGYVSQFDISRPPFFLKPNKVPIRRWLINIMLFFSINVLNNHAFSYNISVPIHIILRSGGSITTLIAGYLFGKRFSRIQIIAVVMLTIGVIIAAWSDSQKEVSHHMKFQILNFEANTFHSKPKLQIRNKASLPSAQASLSSSSPKFSPQ